MDEMVFDTSHVVCRTIFECLRVTREDKRFCTSGVFVILSVTNWFKIGFLDVRAKTFQLVLFGYVLCKKIKIMFCSFCFYFKTVLLYHSFSIYKHYSMSV